MNDIEKRSNTLPNYTLKEELINSISHACGALLSIIGLVLMLYEANTKLEYITCTIFGTSMISLYTTSTIYHALSPKIKAKKIMRILDHCNVYLLVFGTYIPIALITVCEFKAVLLVIFVAIVTVTGIVLTSINIDKFTVSSVVCHLLNGWSAVAIMGEMYNYMGFNGVLLLILGGLMYSIGAILYGIGAHIRYLHSVFHFFCLAGTFFHFLCVYLYVL